METVWRKWGNSFSYESFLVFYLFLIDCFQTGATAAEAEMAAHRMCALGDHSLLFRRLSQKLADYVDDVVENILFSDS